MINNQVSRRSFVQGSDRWDGASFLRATQPEQPNLLWLVREDIGPHLHWCGDEYSVTANFDLLVKRGWVYDNGWHERSDLSERHQLEPGSRSAKAWLTGFQPDTTEMRRDWARYHDLLTLVDRRHRPSSTNWSRTDWSRIPLS